MPKRWIRGLVALVTGVVVATPIAFSTVPATAGPEPLPVVSIGDVTIRDGLKATRTMLFNVSMSRSSETEVDVSFRTIDKTAGPNDFAPRIGVLTFAPGEQHQRIEIQVASDSLNEATEFFKLRLFDASENVTLGRKVGTGTLVDDLPHTGREISIGEASIVQSTTGKLYIHLSVTMSKPALRSVDVKFATQNGSAVSGTGGTGDYQARSGVFTIDQGQTSKSVKVAIRPSESGANRFFTVNIGEPSRYRIGDSSGSAFILSA